MTFTPLAENTRIEHNHILQAPYPDSTMEDCHACMSINPDVMNAQYARMQKVMLNAGY